MRTTGDVRAGFTLSAVVIILVLVLVGMVVWKATFRIDLVPASHPQASAIKTKIMTSSTFTVLGSIALAGGVGAACYFCFGRSQKASNIGMSVTMAVPVALLSIQAYRTMTGPPPTQSQTAQSSNSEFGQSMSDQLKMQAERDRQALRARDRVPSAAPPVAPPQPSTSASTPPPVPNPIATPARPPPKPLDANVVKALDALKAKVESRITEVIATLEPALQTLQKPPRADKSALRKRIDDAKSARDAAAALSATLRDMTDTAWSAAESAGLEHAAAHSQAIRFTNDFDATQRRFACDSLGRLLEQGEKESELLLANFGLWKIGADGKVDSKEFEVRSRAHSARFFIETGLKSTDKDIAKLKGQ